MNVSNPSQTSALELLDELDVRHDALLDELDQLLVRVESVLEDYAKSRGKSADAYKIPKLCPNDELSEPSEMD